MSVRIVYLKKAYIADTYERQSVHDDMAAFSRVIQQIFSDAYIDICAITEDGEWLMHGKSIQPAVTLAQYEYTVVFIHGGDTAYDRAVSQVSGHSGNVLLIYSVSDALFHNAERLQTLIKHNISNGAVKFPHQKHANMQVYNEAVTPVEDIVRAYVRDLFLPIHIVDTNHRNQIPTIHSRELAYTPSEFAALVHDRRHQSDTLTFREHIVGSTVFVIAIPGFRKQKVYTTIPLTYKIVDGVGYWDVIHLTHTERAAVTDTIIDVSSLAFANQVVVYALSIHARRGVFIQSTAPLFDYMIHHPEFFFTAAHESAIAPAELFVLLRDRV